MDDPIGLKEKIASIVKDDSQYHTLSGNNEELEKFQRLFPKESLHQLSLEQYVLGENSIHDNFCRWLERGLESSIGRYSPGTSRGHMLYSMKDGGDLYKLKSLEPYSDELAFEYTKQLHKCVANADVSEDLVWLDDDEKIAAHSNVPETVTMSSARKLRVLQAYNPNYFVPISSVDHIGYFLRKLGVEKTRIPDKKNAIGRALLLRGQLLEFQERAPKLTPYGLMKILYSDALGVRPVARKAKPSDDLEQPKSRTIEESIRTPALNQILYGAPGTGKTYATTELAVKIANSDWGEIISKNLGELELRQAIKESYDKLVKQGQIKFVTFHQSFSYEDFVEGIRANSNNGNISYDIEDGVLKSISDAAINQFSEGLEETVELGDREIWKMSLGNTLAGEDYIFEDCIDNQYASLGYGWNIDFTSCNSREKVAQALREHFSDGEEFSDYAITAVDTFVNRISVGDLIVVSDGNTKVRAIGEVTSPYYYDHEAEIGYYYQKRSVKWHRIFKPSLPREVLLQKSLSQMTIYNLNRSNIDVEQFQGYLTAKNTQEGSVKNYVLIIDEINRGNVSRIFGEAITLLEPDKRVGGADQRSVELPYSKKSFSIPSNLYVIGTMNTADKSLAQIDLALRRRFEFSELLPEPQLLSDISIANFQVEELLAALNDRIEVLLDREHLIGHSYFWTLKTIENESELLSELSLIFEKRIIPLLQEYFFSDWERIAWVLNDHNKPREFQFIQMGGTANSLVDLFGEAVASQLNDRRYSINHDALKRAESYALTINENKSDG